ncbi:MAG: hypothetical protein DRO92_01035 [Candidatus Altiarchaeales archaeon]|nr:MAG: hypothetical protein DRO92_01035 [Candidatus Altiarchaeales archaeon]
MNTGLCDICKKVAILYTCPLCGRRVCSEHFDIRRGVCVECIRGRYLRYLDR